MRIKIKLNESKTKLHEEDTLPPQSSPSKPPGVMQKIKDFVMQAYDVLRAPFAKEMEIEEEDMTPGTMERLITRGATPRVQAIIDRLKAERDERAKIIGDELDKLTVKDLGDEQLDMDFDDGYPLDLDRGGMEYYDPDDDPLGPLQEIAKRHFKQG